MKYIFLIISLSVILITMSTDSLSETINYENGDKYIGDTQYFNGKKLRHGKGEYIFADKSNQGHNSSSRYVGEWERGFYHGKGMLTTSSNYYGMFRITRRYIGEFEYGEKEGEGKEVTTDVHSQKEYIGNWSGGAMHGQGKLTYSDGRVFEGLWDYHEFKEGTYNSRNGIKKGEITYVGEFKNYYFHGKGVITNANGTIEKGLWKNGVLRKYIHD
jgi:hypothetical protein